MDQKTMWADGTAVSTQVQPGVKTQQNPTHPTTIAPSLLATAEKIEPGT